MKTIIHLCADIGSDSKPYADNGYSVVLVGKDLGVEDYSPPDNVYGIIANPPCTEFSRAKKRKGDLELGMTLVHHCLRIIKSCTNLTFWVLENPATGDLRKILGAPSFIYQPWEFGNPWTKSTALWGRFNTPKKIYTRWEDVPKNENLYTRPGRKKPSIAQFHVAHKKYIREFDCFDVKTDSDLRSLCSQGFANAFFEVNR